MTQLSVLSCPAGHMSPLHRTRTSILRPSELVEIQGSYWPRISVVCELKRKHHSKPHKKEHVKSSRRMKKKMELIKHLKHVKSTHVPTTEPISPSLEASSISAFDQNTSPCWKPAPPKTCRKMSSLTGRPVFPSLDNIEKPVQPTSCGLLKGPRRKKSLKGVVVHR